MSGEVDLSEKLAGSDARRSPGIVVDRNGNAVMAVEASGGFVRHAHPETDDFFPAPKGEIDIETRGRTVTPGPGEMSVVPAGVERRPVACGEARLPVIEPCGTPITGDPATAVAKPRA